MLAAGSIANGHRDANANAALPPAAVAAIAAGGADADSTLFASDAAITVTAVTGAVSPSSGLSNTKPVAAAAAATATVTAAARACTAHRLWCVVGHPPTEGAGAGGYACTAAAAA